jgi:hypothetical protein
MLDQAEVGFVVAVGVLATPILFLATVAAAVIQVRRGRATGPRMAGMVAFTGGLTVGGLLLFATTLPTILPLLILPAVIVVSRWRAGRRAQAGWFVAGIALPWTLLWGFFVAVLLAGLERFDPGPTIGSFLLGAVPFVAALVVALRGDPAWARATAGSRPGQRGSHAIGAVASAIHESARVGPFRQPDLALLVAVVAVWLLVPFLIPQTIPDVIRVPVLAVIVAVVGAEAYVRAFPFRARRAFEALSWAGEWELARARAANVGGVPTTAEAAARWLTSRPERPDQLVESMVRVEILVFSERFAEAADLVERLAPTASTPALQFEMASLRDLVDWCGGGDGNLAAVEAAAAAVLPIDSDDRLRAEVGVAVKRVRRLLAEPATARGDAIGPLLEVRERLGRRGDGQVGRALRRRLIPSLFAFSLVFAVVFQVLQGLDAAPL